MPILKFPENESQLRCPAKTIPYFEPAWIKYIEQVGQTCLEVMDSHNGVGLAANQIGHYYKLFVIHEDYRLLGHQIIVNPCIWSYSSEMTEEIEGCLSLPGLYIPIRRSEHILKFTFQDPHGKCYQTTISGFQARIVQHEIDHLSGTLFIDRADASIKDKFLEDYKLLREKNG